MDDVLITPRADAEARREFPAMFNRPPTLRDLHNQMVTAIARLPVGPEPSVYDDWASQADCLEDRALYLRNLLRAMKPVIERISDDAFNIGGAKPELFDLIGDAFTDFIWPLESAAEDLRSDR